MVCWEAVEGECVYSIAAWIATRRNCLGILFDFPLHCVLSFVGGFEKGHDRRRGNIATDSFFLFLSLLLHENHWRFMSFVRESGESYFFFVSPITITAIALRLFLFLNLGLVYPP